MVDTSNKIQCEICKLWYKQITSTHLKQHEITLSEYKFLYPNSPIVSPEISQKLIKANEKKWSNPEYKEKVGNTISKIISNQWKDGKYNRIQSEDHKSKRAKSQSETKQSQIEMYRGEKSGNWKGGISSSTRLYILPINKCIQLNKKFKNSEFHHMIKSIGIYIPLELHQHIRHNLRTGINMGEINLSALQFINGGL